MKHSSFSKQAYADAGTLPLAQLSAQLKQQGFDIRPRDIPARRPRKDQFQCLLMFAFHEDIVPYDGTVSRGERHRGLLHG